MSKPKLLMIYDKRSTFVHRDVEILSEEYTVSELHFKVVPKWKTPVALAVQMFCLLIKGWPLKKVVCQSAGYLSFFPALLSKVMPFKCYIIAIGTDSSRLPEIGYGHFTKPILRTFTKLSFSYCTAILPVHKSLHKSTYTYDDVEFKQQGFGNFIPSLKTPVQEVVNGYKHELFTLTKAFSDRTGDFLTVAVRLNSAAYYRKGLDVIFKAAALLPEKSFTVVSEFTPLDPIPQNVKLIKTVSQKELVEIYNNHKFYLQISMFEGFPNALCEAMLCGCIPIGSAVAAIPEIVDDTGYLLYKRDVSKLLELLKKASGNVGLDAALPRERILTYFPIERRIKELTSAVRL